MYVLVLGLDVLGNPFGLIRGLGEGVTDLFYEPAQGAVQGPGEFAEGLALGVRSLFGHAVGGAAGAVSRITGTLGKGLAALTLDDEYQKKRRERMNKKPTSVHSGVAQGGKSLVMGVWDGVTGIVRKPVEGAKEEGAGGFFKGLGKGVIGLVARPTSGVVDFASASFDTIKRVTDTSEDVRRMRPARVFPASGIVTPLNVREAEGNNIMEEVEKNKFASDNFIAHMQVTKDAKKYLIVTDRRVLFAEHGLVFGQWDCEWQYTWQQISESPKLVPKGLMISITETKKKSLFSRSSTAKIVQVLDPHVAEWLVMKMQTVYAAHHPAKRT